MAKWGLISFPQVSISRELSFSSSSAEPLLQMLVPLPQIIPARAPLQPSLDKEAEIYLFLRFYAIARFLLVQGFRDFARRSSPLALNVNTPKVESTLTCFFVSYGSSSISSKLSTTTSLPPETGRPNRAHTSFSWLIMSFKSLS
jgi:hypothetical protein